MKSRPPKERIYGTHFSFEQGPTRPWEAWVAGDVFGAESHFQGSTKPCVQVLTDGQLKCELCARGAERSWAGWLPLYRVSDNKPVGVVLQEGMYDMAFSVHYGDRVELVKGLGEFDGVSFTRTSGRAYQTTLVPRQSAHDIRPNLIHLWSIQELREWYMNSPFAMKLPDYKHQKHAPVTLTPHEYAAKQDELIAAAKTEEERKRLREIFLWEETRKKLADRVAMGVPSINGTH